MKEATKIVGDLQEEIKSKLREPTRKIVDALIKYGFGFRLIVGEEEGTDYDSVYLRFKRELPNKELGIHIHDRFIKIIMFMIENIKEDKYSVLADTLNTLNTKYRFVTFGTKKDAGKEEYYVAINRDDFYYDNYDPEITFDLVDLMERIIYESYPIIVKAIA